MLQPQPTRVLCLTQAVDPNELKEDEDYEDIVEDMRTECEKFGKLQSDCLSIHIHVFIHDRLLYLFAVHILNCRLPLCCISYGLL